MQTTRNEDCMAKIFGYNTWVNIFLLFEIIVKLDSCRLETVIITILFYKT